MNLLVLSFLAYLDRRKQCYFRAGKFHRTDKTHYVFKVLIWQPSCVYASVLWLAYRGLESSRCPCDPLPIVNSLAGIFMGYSVVNPSAQASSQLRVWSWSHGSACYELCQATYIPHASLNPIVSHWTLLSCSFFQLLYASVFTSSLAFVILVHRLISGHTLAHSEGKHNRQCVPKRATRSDHGFI